MSLHVDSPQHPPCFLLRFWLFLVKLAYSFTGMFKSKATPTTLPPPVTAQSPVTRHRSTPWFRQLELVVKLYNRLSRSQRSIQQQGIASQSPRLPPPTGTREEFFRPTLSNNSDVPNNQNDLRPETYTTGFIDGKVSPGRVSEGTTVRAPTPFSTSHQPSDFVLGHRDSITSVASEIMSPDLLSSSHLLSRRVSFGAVSICRSTIGSILSVSQVRYRLLGIPRSVGTRVSRAESVHSVSALPLSIRRSSSGGSMTMPYPRIRLKSPWSPPDKTLPLDVWVNPQGVLVNAHGPLVPADSPQAEVMLLQYIRLANLRRAQSSRSADEGDSAPLCSHILNLSEEEGCVEEESGKRAFQECPILAVAGLDKCSPGGAAPVVTTTVSAPVEVFPPVITRVSIPNDTRASAEDVEVSNLTQDNISSELDDGFFHVVPASRVDITSDDRIPGLAYIPSLKHREVRPLSVAAEHLPRTDRVSRCFSVPYFSLNPQSDEGLVRTSTSSSSKSFKFPDALECRSPRALADLISLLDLTALQTEETMGVSEIRMGNYLVRAD
ncbi:hypothetical protein AZE42_08202 [Rhizopogon vesiculosus]|uniref:Uncharacterized protein n=1 Tax=Rhizopogon vesiculosus TaxID=180088 RepID=A0A1J8QFS1_9AGAM|nr:hypothetical protein AZE42_08202 [Rhizopogon vesiculosus]